MISDLTLEKDQIGIRLRKIRIDQKLTQKEFGNLLGMHQSHIHMIEDGSNFPTVEMLVKLTNHFGIDLKYFLTGINRSHTLINARDMPTIELKKLSLEITTELFRRVP